MRRGKFGISSGCGSYWDFFFAAEPHGNSSKLPIGGRGRIRCGPVVIQTLFLTSLFH